MRPLEDLWFELDGIDDHEVSWRLVAELRRWTEEQRRVNVGLVAENAQLRKRVRELQTTTTRSALVLANPLPDV